MNHTATTRSMTALLHCGGSRHSCSPQPLPPMKCVSTWTSLVLLITFLCTATVHAQTPGATLSAPRIFNTIDLTDATTVPISARSTTTRSELWPRHSALRTSVRMSSSAAPVPSSLLPPNEIALKRGFFKPLRFSYSDGELEKVYGFSGLSFHESFEEVISQHPPALDAAGKARLYNGIGLAGGVVMVIGSVQMLQSSLDQADAVNSGNLNAANESLDGLGTMLVGLGVMTVGNVLAGRALKRGVRLFNERQRVHAGTAGHTQR